MSVKTFLFDLGNVLYTFDFQLVHSFLRERCPGYDLTMLPELRDLLRSYESGNTSTMDFFQGVKEKIGFKGDFPEFRKGFSEIFFENKDTLPIVRKLMKKHPLYVLSNTNEMHIDYITSNFPFFNEISGKVYSFEVGFSKPDPRIYEAAIKKFNLTPQDTLFIDDLEKNIDAASRLGFQTLHYRMNNGKPEISLQEELTRIGIEV